MSAPGIGLRLAQTRRLLAAEGTAGIAARLRERAAALLVPPGSKALIVDASDFVGMDDLPPTTELSHPRPDWRPGTGLSISFVCVPPGGGSGGHTTLFRLVAALEEAGHRCVIHLRERHGWDLEQHRDTMRTWWPWLRAEVRSLADGIDDCDAIVATGWDTAYDVRRSPARGVRFYLVQDYEPMFYAAGSASLLAEATYGFGFHGLTAGAWLAERLQAEHGMPSDHFDFGCDVEVYRASQADLDAERSGICYYCRPSSPRRAHELAVFALELFHARHPDVEIHFYGEPAPGLRFPVTHHGLLDTARLADLYRRCVAGLALSATNVSLVPHEMLAAGCLPVVNDAAHNRMVLANDHVRYAAATPASVADALSAAVCAAPPDRAASARAAARSVESTSWADAARQLEQALVAEVGRRASLSEVVP